MSELIGHRAHATEAADDLFDVHAYNVRLERTLVNVDNVPGFRDIPGMSEISVGDRLIALRARSGLSMEKVAKAMNLAGRSSVQRFFDPSLERISIDDAVKLSEVLADRGSPPITREEVMALTGIRSVFEVAPNNELAPKYMDLPSDVPVYGTAMGTYLSGDEGVVAIEQAFIDYAETVDHLPRPPGYLTRTGLYGVYITGDSMEPRWEAGDPAYADPKKVPAIGDDVIVYLTRENGTPEGEPVAVLIKRLIRRSATFVELRQFNPDVTFRVETRHIKAIHRVIPRRELLTVK